MTTNDIEKYKLYLGDCLQVMDKLIEEGVIVDAIITDPPYGTTACKWDTVIPFNEMWERLDKLIKPNGAVVLFGSEPFSSTLRLSNIEDFKYDWIWKKNTGSNFLQANYQPIKRHEIISVFGKYPASYTKSELKLNYNPQMDTNGKVYSDRKTQNIQDGLNAWRNRMSKDYKFKRNNNKGTFPTSILEFKGVIKDRLHASEKPVELLEYLIKTYTDEGDLVLDFTMGSGSTGVACLNTNRRFIGIELDEKYFNIAKDRIENNKVNGVDTEKVITETDTSKKQKKLF